ncbi:MAG TPA: AraC family transcriptional regulator ligand-binding domain-containing protein [Candidatus Binatia bacterium]|jgi:AraC-like DNA-binding protein
MLSQFVPGFSAGLPMTSAYLRLITRANAATARERSALLEGTGLPAGDHAAGEITLGQQLRQVRNANRLLEPGWALAMGARFHAATHGPIGVGVVSAPTLRQSVEIMTRFSHVRSPHFRLRADVRDHEVRLVPQDLVMLADAERAALLDIVLLSTQGLVESAIGRPMHEGRFELPFAAPPHARRYAECFRAPVAFDRDHAAVVFPRAWLDIECPLADPLLLATAVRTLATGARRLDGGSFVPARVEQILAAHGDRGVGTAARALGMSRRTLARRLHESGASYRALREAQQRNEATRLLRERHLSIADVAYALRYEDPANFGRACRRWFGMGPRAYRRLVVVN